MSATAAPAETTSEYAVEIDGLAVEVTGGRVIVDSVSLAIEPGRILGLVGESGSGKTTVSMAVLGYVRPGAEITQGRVSVAGRDVRSLDQAGLLALRGAGASYVPQDPRAAFNPALRIGAQLLECVEAGAPELDAAGRRARVAEALDAVGLPADAEFQNRFPHQLSGGQLQRVGIAIAIAPRPRVVVWDEPTTGLDVITQHRILELVRSLCSRYSIAGLYVTHDLAVLPDLADDLAVMRDGAIVEQGAASSVLADPQHPYTRQLLASVPSMRIDVGDADALAAEPRSEPLLEVKGLNASYRRHPVLRGVDLEVSAGECVAVVGESGSGKTTLSRSLIGLHHEHEGEARWRGKQLARKAARRSRDERRQLQYIFQSPHSALNPRASVLDSIVFARKTVHRDRAAQHRSAALDALRMVELDPAKGDLLPATLSGGERQRVAIARALVTDPQLIICDEITSALDVVVQQRIMELLMGLRDQTGLSYLFVTHNIALVSDIADRVLVLKSGRIEESGRTGGVLRHPKSQYVKDLVAYTPTLDSGIDRAAGTE
ncbi:ABC transporter ATP-binding protein [Leucobacter tenebrionis]|uniref:ABC transporter ATP-binding protein n=1 Tax=Leucobacter tenebrionis TaxID=2873270 RepID=UPI001CA62F52|nr:ABC transporter ATP-binding protein [Leucobacter tenebrionis]QZY51714.1 ABC transporter ATP-binding protein [Leucobacter tenebrionis]